MAERSRPAYEELLPMSVDELITIKQGRWGEVQEVAELAAFLASGEAGLITGAAVAIDGGVSASLI
jgi:NAD(P)-dependent dehydrogenase (short-subunit alcohol dehydrogenase family)